MVKTVLKIDGMMCGMCEAHMNDLILQEFQGEESDIFCQGWRDSDHQ